MNLQHHPEHRANSHKDPDEPARGEKGSVMFAVRAVLGWMTPYEQLVYLREKGHLKAWERFRDSLMRRWSNLNVICGLIMGAVSTIVFADFPLTSASFTLGIISLLSSLISIGFGVGMIYVLGDVQGGTLRMIDRRYPNLYLFALSIPEVWAFISFGTFFTGVGVIVWQSADKGWIAKAGVTVSAVALLGHLAAFAFLFREQDTAKFLVDEMSAPDVLQNGAHQSGWVNGGDARLGSDDEVSQVPHPSRPGLPARPMRSTQTLVGSPMSVSFSHSKAPLRTKTASESTRRLSTEFVIEPEGEIATLDR
ncbi:hypothetical protein M0805_007530 [Coniferiporia weirii]|nr:hypothetical protein M0805_007530 [Coniferiporia weirii]